MRQNPGSISGGIWLRHCELQTKHKSVLRKCSYGHQKKAIKKLLKKVSLSSRKTELSAAKVKLFN